MAAMAAMVEAALPDRRFTIAARNRCEDWSATICYCARVRRTVKGAQPYIKGMLDGGTTLAGQIASLAQVEVGASLAVCSLLC